MTRTNCGTETAPSYSISHRSGVLNRSHPSRRGFYGRIKFEYGKIAPGFFAWLFGHRRHCLRVMNVLDGDLQTIVVCISVNSYGSALVVNWWLLTKLGFWRWLLERAGYWLDNKKPPVPLTVELDVVQKDILMKGFVTVVVTALQRAVEAVMQELGQDKGTVDSKSGFVI